MEKLFESADIAENYLKFRPSYSEKLANETMKFHGNQQKDRPPTEKLGLMVDVGCGSGQSINIFQSYFNQVVGVDVSAEQLKRAKKQNIYEHIQYVEGCAEELPLKNNSADLIVCGMAVHWFDLPKFFSECKRVLKPNGCIAIFGYWVPKITPIHNKCEILSAKGTQLLDDLMLNGVSSTPAEKQAHFQIKKRYQDIFDMIPFEVKHRVNNIHVINEYSMNEMRGLVRSTDSEQSHIDKDAHEVKNGYDEISQEELNCNDIAVKFSMELKTLWNLETKSDDEKIMTVDYDYFLLLACP